MKNPVKEALRAGQPQVGTWLSLGDPLATRLMARVGFPWLTVDLEHSPIDWSQAAVQFALIAEAGCVPLARVPRGDHDYIKRVLDAGAMGIVVPMVDTPEQARAAVAAAKYPPVGNRSVGGTAHALNFGVSPGEYFARANDTILVVLQTESPRGIENAEAIYGLPGVDAIFVGPNDLSFQMRSPDGADPTPEAFEAALQEVVRIGRRVGTPVGIHVQTPEQVRQRVAQGFQFIALASELKMMVDRAQQWAAELDLGRAGDIARY